MDYVLGVDGGNTKTVALVARTDGAIIGAGRSGCGDIYGVLGTEGAFASMRDAVHDALRSAGIDGVEVCESAFSLAGADWPEDFTFLRDELSRRGVAERAVIVNDAIGALRAGSRNGMGVSLAVGTGTAVGARGMDGRVWHVSFWMWEAHGSGELSRQVMRALSRADLGIDPPTSLAPRLCEVFGAASVEELLHRITKREGKDIPLRQLAPALIVECERGDPTARQIVRNFGLTLGDYALAATRKVGLLDCEFDLVLAGGVLRSNSHYLINTLVERVHTAAPGARPVRARMEPAAGALMLALESAGVCVDEQLVATMIATLPPASFFSTG